MAQDFDSENVEWSIRPFDEFGSPTVTASRGGVGTATTAEINVPTSGPEQFDPAELREMADEIEENGELLSIKLLLGSADPEEFADGLREAADWVEDVMEEE